MQDHSGLFQRPWVFAVSICQGPCLDFLASNSRDRDGSVLGDWSDAWCGLDQLISGELVFGDDDAMVLVKLASEDFQGFVRFNSSFNLFKFKPKHPRL